MTGVAPDFPKPIVDALAKRAAQICSNPSCRTPTSGPHSDPSRAVVVGDAAHIRGARRDSARHDPTMSDQERAHPSNGIWLCSPCARRIDRDESRYPAKLLLQWKTDHEAWVDAGCPSEKPPIREVVVTDGGVGSAIFNQGPGAALRVAPAPAQPGERIRVEGRGIGELIVNTGPGTGKEVVSSGATASQSTVVVNQPVQLASGLHATLAVVLCESCGTQFNVGKVVQAFAGDREPKTHASCPNCGAVRWV